MPFIPENNLNDQSSSQYDNWRPTDLIIGTSRMGKTTMWEIVAAAKRDTSSPWLQAMAAHIEQRRHPVAQLATWVRQTLSLTGSATTLNHL
jgi:hypothetical protein